MLYWTLKWTVSLWNPNRLISVSNEGYWIGKIWSYEGSFY